jgi:agmatine deiminase
LSKDIISTMIRFHFPAEWAPHQAVWIGFPSDPELWLDDLAPAQAEVAAFARAVHAAGAGEQVRLVVSHADALAAAKRLAPFAELVEAKFFDIWLRDSGPLVVSGPDGRTGLDYCFNSWGNKYPPELDQAMGAALAADLSLPVIARNWVLEGGAIDVDGAGLLVTTEQCLLNPNRNPGMSRQAMEAAFAADLGVSRVLWLGDGLAGDSHTDGHVDNLARFVGPNRLALPVAAGPDDPNAAVYADAAARARAFGVEVALLPSPGRIERDGEIVPASYMNFYIGNAAVVVPTYGVPNDTAAVQAIQQLFPDRRVIGLPAEHLLTGGGSFHCISQQVPA